MSASNKPRIVEMDGSPENRFGLAISSYIWATAKAKTSATEITISEG